MKQNLYNNIVERKKLGQKSFAVLIDPDKVNREQTDSLISLAVDARVDYFFVGGSLVISNNLDDCIRQIKSNCDIPVTLFPGAPSQVSRYADALLYLSLISGRNPELLIGQHVDGDGHEVRKVVVLKHGHDEAGDDTAMLDPDELDDEALLAAGDGQRIVVKRRKVLSDAPAQ